MGHVVYQWVYFTWKVPHDGQGGHVQGYSGAGLEPSLVKLTTAANNIPGPISGFDNDCRNL